MGTGGVRGGGGGYPELGSPNIVPDEPVSWFMEHVTIRNPVTPLCLIHNVVTKPLAAAFKMENVSSPVTALSFMPTFSSNQESDGDKTSFETSASSVNCFAEVVVTQNYSDISRYVLL